MTPIEGTATRSFEQAQAWARSRGAAQCYVDNAPRYWWFCTQAGLRPEVMFAHHGKETNLGRFGGVLDESFHNPAGIKKAGGGGDYDPDAHERFLNWDDGVRAHVNHMLAYVHGRDVTFIGVPHARARVVQTTSWAGTITQVEDLDARWAPSPTYGRDLVRIFLQPLLDHAKEHPVRIVSRSAWGARPPTTKRAITTPTPRLWVHHLASEWHGPKGVRQTQAFHMDTKGWSDIAYSFLADDDGTIYEGRGAGVAGAHTEGDNSGSHAIVAMGNFDVRRPSRAMVESIARLAAHGRTQGWWGDITGGHRDAPKAQTACPGRHLYAAIPDIRALTTTSNQEDDMTAEQAAWLGRVHHELVAEQQSVRELVAQTRMESATTQQKLDRLILKLNA